MKTLIPILIGLLVVGCGGSKEKVAPKTQPKAKATPKVKSKGDATPKAKPKAEAKKPLTKEESAKVIEAEIREELKKPTGELTKADLEKVKALFLGNNQLTDVKGLEKLTKLEYLYLSLNPDLTKAQIAELQKALPKCKIGSSPKK